jgi:endonuclease/exonuclease/phosphatase family metal-dependent hydrolase
VRFTALTWNLFHGRDFPPDPALRTWRSRLLRSEERNDTHIQVNRDLEAEFATMLADAEWDVALLQECPPRFAESLARACGAEAHRVLTSRNSFGALRAAVARHNPDLIASNEGGSNLTLVRSGRILARREETIHSGPLERRAMALTRIALDDEAELCVANLHATANRPELATEDVLRAAASATEWAGGVPLLFGGDLNLRPQADQKAFAQLRSRHSLDGATGPDAIDHLLGCGLEVIEGPTPWPPEQREVPYRGLVLRLSDHAPVQAKFQIG